MAALNLPDLLREKKDPSGKKFIDRIPEKIETGTPFTRAKGKMGSTGSVENDADNVYLEFASDEANFAFNQINGLKYSDIPEGLIFRNAKDKKELIRLSGIEKTTELGSGKGSGGGAEATAQTESMCCYFAAYLFNGPLTQFDLSENYEKVLKTFYGSKGTGKEYVHAYHQSRYELSKKDKGLWDKAPTDNEWMQTYMATANKIKSSATQFTKKPVYFHRGSPFMDSIYAKKKKCEKHNKDLVKSGDSPQSLKESLTSFSNDKWNPGDIWISTNQPTKEPFTWEAPTVSKGSQKHICDWPNLQESVYQSAMKGETLGISLKKTGSSAKLGIFNLPKSLYSLIPTKYVGYKFGSGDFFNSTDVYLQFSDGKMQYRPTDSTKSWQGEIKGTKASGGKAGGGATNYYIELRNGDSSSIGPTKSKKESGTWSEKKGKVTTGEKQQLYKFYELYNKKGIDSKKTSVKFAKGKAKNPYVALSNDFDRGEEGNKFFTYTSKKDTVSEYDFMILGDGYTSKGNNAAASFWFGKYMALYLVDALHKPGDNNGFAKNIVRYAQSSIDNVSSYFWKIS